MDCEHHWGVDRDELPRGYAVRCDDCGAWKLVATVRMPDGEMPQPVILPQANVDRAAGFLLTEEQIRALP